MKTGGRVPEIYPLTGISLGILLVFYPATIAAVGPLSNGGILGFSALVVAATCSWTAFIRCRPKPLIRWLILLPISIIVTWAAVWDGLAQYQLGLWRGL